MLPKKLKKKLDDRKAIHALRQLGTPPNLVDFSSNDYLGFSKSETVFNNSHALLLDQNIKQNGSTGSRLLSGNNPLYQQVERMLSNFHKSEAALVYNSGYDANVGFFSSVPQRGDIILFDEFIHASIRDGISLGHAKAYKFRHNDLVNLNGMLKRVQHDTIYVVTESVFSMDGDSPDLVVLSQLCKKYKAHLIVDEAHAVGVFGTQGEGLIQHLKLERAVFARIITLGKALGCHGAAILGPEDLKHYLVNFSRSFIYTTALPPHSLATIHAVYKELVILSEVEASHPAIEKLHENILFFKAEIKRLNLDAFLPEKTRGFIESDSAIHCCIIPGNETVKTMAEKIQEQGFYVKPILSPTVPEGQERLRFCLHSYNSKEEIKEVLRIFATFMA